MSKESYDLAIVGGGPGGYVGAIRAAQLGMKVACIEKRKTLGGTCLNVGCIPSKALLESSHKFQDARNNFAQHGIALGSVTANIKDMLARKNTVVENLTKGIDFLFKKNGVKRIEGIARLLGDGKISIGKKEIFAKNIIVATGSVSAQIPNVTVDEDTVVSSTGALEFKEVPKHLVIIGGGVIGLELGSVWQRLGSDVTVIEYADSICPTLDKDVIKQFTRSLKKQGFQFHVKTKVVGVEKKAKGAVVKTQSRDGGEEKTLTGDKVLVCVGRRPYVDGLNLENVGVELTDRGTIAVDKNFQSSVAGIYAIGDVILGPMLAHKAEEDGVACVEHLAGLPTHVDYNTTPNVIYTHPEVASVGKTEQDLIDSGIAYTAYQFPFIANSRSRTNGEAEGFVKLIAEKTTDRLLGAHMVGADAGTLIHEAVIIMQYNGTTEDIFRCCHAHPTLNEAIKEAALGVHGRAIHT